MSLEVNILSPCKFNMITVASQEVREMSLIRIFKLKLKLTMNLALMVRYKIMINVCLPVRVMILNVARINQNFKSRRVRMKGIIFPFFNVCSYHVHSANLIKQVKFITELQQMEEIISRTEFVKTCQGWGGVKSLKSKTTWQSETTHKLSFCGLSSLMLYQYQH